MKVSCLIGSPRPNSNSAAIAARFTETAASLGAKIETTVLNQLTYRGCQGCMACKTHSEKCVLQDDLANVLESLKGADIVVLALPVYCSDVPGQVKCFIDRTYAYMPPNFMQGAPSRVPPGKKFVYIVTQGAPVEEMFADVAKRYSLDGFRRDVYYPRNRCRERRHRGRSRRSSSKVRRTCPHTFQIVPNGDAHLFPRK
jgi:multimeric flavodoxin WrbA